MALKMKRKRKNAVMRTMCPHCQHVCHAYKSEQVTELTRELSYRCSNEDCGHAFKATLYVTCTITLSNTPNNKLRNKSSCRIKAPYLSLKTTNLHVRLVVFYSLKHRFYM
jgi:hypothetical protein